MITYLVYIYIYLLVFMFLFFLRKSGPLKIFHPTEQISRIRQLLRILWACTIQGLVNDYLSPTCENDYSMFFWKYRIFGRMTIHWEYLGVSSMIIHFWREVHSTQEIFHVKKGTFDSGCLHLEVDRAIAAIDRIARIEITVRSPGIIR